jgi:hypothetical protein
MGLRLKDAVAISMEKIKAIISSTSTGKAKNAPDQIGVQG